MKKKNQDLIITCKFCIYSKNSIIDKRREVVCEKTKKEVSEKTPICENFECVKFIFCENRRRGRGQWIAIAVCLNRQLTKKYGCNKCKDGKVIKKLIDIGS
jgi:hypothetical protein